MRTFLIYAACFIIGLFGLYVGIQFCYIHQITNKILLMLIPTVVMSGFLVIFTKLYIKSLK